MDKQNHSDIAAFPELFDGMEQFILKISIGDVQLAGNTGRLWV